MNGILNIISMTAKKPEGIISIKEAQDYHKKYKSDSDGRMANNQQTVYGWHSLENIKRYIEYIEEEAQKKGVEVSGLNVYFGSGEPINGSDKGQLTHFIAPTYEDKVTKKHEAFDSFSSTDKNPRKIHKSIIEGEDDRTFSNENSLLLNRSVICPPFCN
jgi:hypothetical protein